MRRIFVALPALAFCALAPASAQVSTPTGVAGARLYNWCMQLPQASPSECSCTVGFYSGATAEDEYRIIGAMIGYLRPDGSVTDEAALVEAIDAEAAAMDMTDDRLNEVIAGFAAFGDLGDKADAICVPLEAHVDSLASE